MPNPPKPPPLDDDARQLAGRLSSVRISFIECRTIGHAWRIRYIGPLRGVDDPDIRERASRSSYRPDSVRHLRCSRCRTERVDLCLVGYGRRAYSYFLTGRYYRYPDGYAIEGAVDHRDLLHNALFEREGQ